jgi:Aspartyl protease
MSPRLGALLGLLALAGCQPAVNAMYGVGDCKLEKLGEAPVETRSKLVMVSVRIDGHPADLVVDTGAERTLLSPAAVTRLHLYPDMVHGTRSWGVGGPTAHFDAAVDDFELAGMQLPLRSVAVGDLDVTPLQGGVDGVLGTDVLRWFTVDLDAPDGRMTLYRGEPCWLKAPPWPEASTPLEGVRVGRSGRELPRMLLLPIEIDGVKAMALLDTGSQASAITLALADRVGVSQKVLRSDPAITIGGAGPDTVSAPLHRFHSLRVGAWIATNPVLPVLDLPQQLDQQPLIEERPWQGLIGQDFLHGHRLWFSLAGWQVFISRPGPPVTQP